MNDRPKLITWTHRTSHLYFEKEFVLPNGTIIPAGTLCGRYPLKKGRFGTWDGKSHDVIWLEFGSFHLYANSPSIGDTRFCQRCMRKIQQFGMADKMGLLSKRG